MTREELKKLPCPQLMAYYLNNKKSLSKEDQTFIRKLHRKKLNNHAYYESHKGLKKYLKSQVVNNEC